MPNAEPIQKGRRTQNEAEVSPATPLGRLAARDLPSTLYLVGLALIQFYVIVYASLLHPYLPFKGKWSYLALLLFVLGEALVFFRDGLRGVFPDKRSVIGALCVLVSVPVSLCSGSSTALVVCMALFSARRMRFEDIARTALWVMGVTVTVIVICSLVGIVDNVVWVQQSRVRHGLGMKYTTTTGHYLFFMTLLLIYLRRGKLRAKEVVCISVLNVCIFLLTNSRNSFTLTFAALALSQALRIRPQIRVKKIVSLLFGAFVPVMAMVSIALMFLYSPDVPYMETVNQALGGRVLISNNSYMKYGIEPFGQEVDFVGQGVGDDGQRAEGNPTVIDNSYCNILVTRGPLFTVMVVGLLAAFLYLTMESGAYNAALIMSLVCLHSFLDPQLVTLQYDIPLLLLGPCLFGDDVRQREELAYGRPLAFAEPGIQGRKAPANGVSPMLATAPLVIAIAASVAYTGVQLVIDSNRPPAGIPSKYYRLSDMDGDKLGEPILLYTWSSINTTHMRMRLGDYIYVSDGNLMVHYRGLLSPLTTGDYEIKMTGKGSGSLTIDDVPVLKITELKPGAKETQYTAPIPMKAGSFHKISAEWTDTGDCNAFRLYWRTAGNKEWHIIPFYCYFHDADMEYDW